MQIIPHFFFFVFPLPQPARPIFIKLTEVDDLVDINCLKNKISVYSYIVP